MSGERFRAFTEAWQAVDRAIRPLGHGGGASNSPWNEGYQRAKNEALNAILALRESSAAALDGLPDTPTVSREGVYWAARYFGLDSEAFLAMADDPVETAKTAAYYGQGSSVAPAMVSMVDRLRDDLDAALAANSELRHALDAYETPHIGGFVAPDDYEYGLRLHHRGPASPDADVTP